MPLRSFDNTDELSEAVGEYLVHVSRVAIREHGAFYLAVSGGSLPKLAFSWLVRSPAAKHVGVPPLIGGLQGWAGCVVADGGGGGGGGRSTGRRGGCFSWTSGA